MEAIPAIVPGTSQLRAPLQNEVLDAPAAEPVARGQARLPAADHQGIDALASTGAGALRAFARAPAPRRARELAEQRAQEGLGLLHRRRIARVFDHVQGPAVLHAGSARDGHRCREIVTAPEQTDRRVDFREHLARNGWQPEIRHQGVDCCGGALGARPLDVVGLEGCPEFAQPALERHEVVSAEAPERPVCLLARGGAEGAERACALSSARTQSLASSCSCDAASSRYPRSTHSSGAASTSRRARASQPWACPCSPRKSSRSPTQNAARAALVGRLLFRWAR